MHDNESLAELKKIAAWTDMQRKLSRWALISVPVFISAVVVFAVVMEYRAKKHFASLGGLNIPEPPTWYGVESNICRCNLDEAIRIGEELIQKTPQYWEGHRRLASAYLAAGKIEKARQHYAEALRLLPSEENEKLLIAIDKRINEERSQPDNPANGSQP